MAYRYNPRTSDPYDSRPDRTTFRAHNSARYHPPPADYNWARTQLIGIILVALLLWKYEALCRLVSSLVYDPKGTLTGLIEMVGYKLTGLGAQLSQTKVEWAQSDGDEGGKDGKPVRRYKDILGPPVEGGKLLGREAFSTATELWLTTRSPLQQAQTTQDCSMQQETCATSTQHYR
jgi:hypothetical protein